MPQSHKINYPKELNSAQLKAVHSTEGPHLVIAGAGSGKTRVLVYRVAYLVEKGIRPEDILLLTFTRKAAQEMLSRATLILDDRCQKVSGGTFHSFANSTLRRHGSLIGLFPNFTILDQADAENAINMVRTHLGLHKQDKRFPKKHTLLNLISKSVNTVQDLVTVIGEEAPHFLEWSAAIARIKEEYASYKKRMSVLDYDDLLIFLRDLLTDHPELRKNLSRQYRYLMVDEYQDTNKIQAEIVRLLTSEHQNIMVVGDDSQSIYSFRGANFKNIMQFPKMFPGTQVITLEENYRSVQPILNLTNEVVKASSEKFAKTLYSKKESDYLPTFVEADYENGQSKYIVSKILELHKSGVSLDDMAVLFRSGWHVNDLEVELASRGVPFVKYGGQKFVEAAHVKDLLCFLRIRHNLYDELSWQRVLLLLSGVGPKAASDLIEAIVHHKKGLAIEEKLLKKRVQLKELLEIYKSLADETPTPQELIKLFHKFYLPILMDIHDDFDKRLNDLQSLERIAMRYTNLEEFLTDLALDPPEETVVNRRSTKETLTLSTIHSAKGLEWHTVFVVHLSEGHLPSYRSFNREEDIEEERRLFYVATTRAKENLFLLRTRLGYSTTNPWDGGGGLIHIRMSRFLEEGEILSRYVDFDNISSRAVPW